MFDDARGGGTALAADLTAKFNTLRTRTGLLFGTEARISLAGPYATEVIRDAIRPMQAEEQRVAAFRKAVAEGEAQLDRGEGIEYSRELMNKLADTARKNIGSGKPIDADVTP